MSRFGLRERIAVGAVAASAAALMAVLVLVAPGLKRGTVENTRRTLLKLEVLPEHVANAVFVLTAGELSHTTGVHLPVDAGVPAAFLR